MTLEINCRGLNCPAPVLQTKKVIEENRPAGIRITVDNEAARENVTRFLTSQGYAATAGEVEGGYQVKGTLSGEPGEQSVSEPSPEAGGPKKTMLLVSTDRMGFGDDQLGRKLMLSFLRTVSEMGDELWRLVFVNNGVKLSIDGSDVLETLQDYEANGLHILVCGTCLTHFDLLEAKQVGQTTNMLDIVTAMQLADKVITI